jgi:hypothetical protein
MKFHCYVARTLLAMWTFSVACVVDTRTTGLTQHSAHPVYALSQQKRSCLFERETDIELSLLVRGGARPARSIRDSLRYLKQKFSSLLPKFLRKYVLGAPRKVRYKRSAPVSTVPARASPARSSNRVEKVTKLNHICCIPVRRFMCLLASYAVRKCKSL